MSLHPELVSEINLGKCKIQWPVFLNAVEAFYVPRSHGESPSQLNLKRKVLMSTSTISILSIKLQGVRIVDLMAFLF